MKRRAVRAQGAQVGSIVVKGPAACHALIEALSGKPFPPPRSETGWRCGCGEFNGPEHTNCPECLEDKP